MKRVFLSIPVQGLRLAQAAYDNIVAGAHAASLVILNPEVNQPPTSTELVWTSSKVVHSHNRALLANADFIIAEISYPSLGVGYELGVAESLGKPVLALCDESRLAQVSLMVRGLAYDRFHLILYHDPQEIHAIIDWFTAAGPEQTKFVQASDAVIGRHFDELAPAYDDSTEWRRDDHLLTWLAQGVQACNVCLDLACGTGLVGDRVRGSARVVIGIDQSLPMLRLGLPRLDACVSGDIARLPFRSATFDGIIVRQVLHYVDDRRCLQEARRTLRSEGVVVCAQASATDVSVAAWWEQIKSYTQPLRRRFYTEAMLVSRFESAGFRVIDVERYYIARRETWAGVVRHCPSYSHEIVRQLFADAPLAVREATGLKLSDHGVEYRQQWTLLRATAEREPGV